VIDILDNRAAMAEADRQKAVERAQSELLLPAAE
jgi:hypothetical protein